jgi:hypothetical protein
VAALAACSSSGGPGGGSSDGGSSSGTYTWGINAELSGPLSFYGDGIVSGVKAYAETVNARGGINGHKINVVQLDNQGDQATSAANETQLATADKAVAIFGAVLSTDCAGMLPIVRQLWADESVNHHGEFDVIDRAGINPRPVRQSVPIWIGCGDAPAALERVGRLADGWIPHPALGDGERLEQAWATVRTAAERAGRDPASLGLQGQVRLRETGAAAAGGKLERWAGLGATHIAINPLQAGLSWPHGHLDACLEVLSLWTGSPR